MKDECIQSKIQKFALQKIADFKNKFYMDEYWLQKDSGQKQNYLYFFEEESIDKQPHPQRLTMDSDDEVIKPLGCDKKFRAEVPGFTSERSLQDANFFKKEKIREKLGIQINSVERVKYIQARKGTKEETNDLTINITKIIKNTLPEFKHFFGPNLEELNSIQKFQEQKPNLLAIRSLFGVEEEETVEDHSNVKKIKRKETKRSQRIRKFVEEKLKDEIIFKQFLKSKKMSFVNKLRTIKFLEVARRGCIDPAHFNCWKSGEL